MSDVFISYSRKDSTFVQRLHDALTERDYDVWVDWKDIPFSSDWWAEIRSGIESAGAFIFVITENSTSSPICNLELAHAIKHHKRLVPLVRGTTDIRVSLEELEDRSANDDLRKSLVMSNIVGLASENWDVLKRYNWLTFTDDSAFNQSFEQLLETLETDLVYIREHTRLLVRATEWESNDHNESFLLRGQELREAETWLSDSSHKQPEPNRLHSQYIIASRTASNRSQRTLLAGVSAALVIAVALAVLSFFLFIQSEDRRVQADNNAAAATIAQGEAVLQANAAATSAANALAAENVAQRRADESRSLLWANAAQQALENNDTRVALPLALAAVNISNPPALAQRTLANAAYEPGAQRQLATTAAVNGVSISPDGIHAAAALADGTLTMWNIQTGAPVRAFNGHTLPVTSVIFSPGGEQMLSGSWDRSLILWNTSTGAIIHQLQGHSGVVSTVDISPDGSKALSGSLDNSMILWDLAAGASIQTYPIDIGDILSVAISPDGQTALAGSDSRNLILFNLETGEIIHNLRGHTSDVLSVAFSPNGQSALSSSQDGTIILWDVNVGVPLRWLNRGGVGHTLPPNHVIFSPDGSQALSGSEDSSIILWDLNSGQVIHVFEGHTAAVHSLAFSPDARTAISGADDNTVILWSTQDDAWLSQITNPETSANTAAFNPTAESVLVGYNTGSVKLYDLTTQQELMVFNGHTEAVNSVAFSPDGRTMISASDDAAIRLWDVNSGVLVRTFTGHTAGIHSAIFSPDGRQILSGSDDNTLILWDALNGDIIRQLGGENGHNRRVLSVAFSPDSKTALSGAADRQMIVWNLETGEPLQTFTAHTRRVVSVAYDPTDPTLAISGSDDGSMVAWNLTTGAEIRRFTAGIDGSTEAIASLDYSPSAAVVIVGTESGSITLWDIQTGQAVRRFSVNANITSVSFNAAGTAAISGLGDGSLIIWRTESLSELINWTYANRLVPELNCTQREQYTVEPLCDEEGIFPTRTPLASAANP